MKRGYKPRDLAERFWEKVDRHPTGCWEWTGSRSAYGYGKFGIGHQRHTQAHRVAAMLSLPEFNPQLSVLHRCDNPPCVRPSHLFLGTHADNMSDASSKKRMHGSGLRGEGVNTAKVSEADVVAIRTRYAAGGVTQKELASEFGLDQTSVSDIVRRNNWRHVL